MRRKIPSSIQKEVRQRANFLCEYCHASENWQYVAFTIEHVIPISLGGNDRFGNLALCCFACNRRKSNQTDGLDPKTDEIVHLFNPRIHQWHEHFIWSIDKLTIIGLTPIGRATVNALEFNRGRVIVIRKADLEIGRHPPENDLIL
ncbi:HNH endonuclease [bacterium]|nr:HNH endonuclease [bacterium]